MNAPSEPAGDAAKATQQHPTKPSAQPLAGLRVLDLTQVMAGPFATMLLGDLGADIIKIEPPGTGDQTRGAMGFKMKGPDSMGFLNLNRNKRSIAINLKTDAGREIFYRLVKTADILIENYRPGVMRRLGCDYATLAAINPRLIYASISGFGQTGPWASRPGFDLMAQAMSGVLSVTGQPGGPPAKGVPVADIGCGLFTVYAVLAAVIGQRQSGEGQYIDASLFEAALAFSIWDAADYWGTGVVPTPLGTANRMSAPYQAVKAKDGYFVFGATNPKLWQLLCEVLDRKDLFEDLRFTDIVLRLANRDALIEALEQSFGTRPSCEWVELLLAAGIPAAPIYNYAEAFDSAQAHDRNMRLEIDHPVEGKIPNIGFPVKLAGTPQQVRHAPPLLGEHTAAILDEVGIDATVLQDFKARGAFTP
jgi:crotonobetainyl-CoA:carnitine CoA-transferase CaiB-like acyl-CoA transferase